MDSAAQEQLVLRARAGDPRALAQLFEHSRPRLERMVELRIDAAVRRRLDPADVVQDAWVEVARRFEQWCAQDELPLHVWMRLITAQALAQAQRRHLAAHKRDVLREVPLGAAALRESRVSTTAANVADAFAASATSPSQAAGRAELRARVLVALEELDELDREILALRHFEGLSNDDAALELAITPAAASKRFVRALLRLRPALESLGGESAGSLA